jgi:hypothetical protein
VAIGTAGVVAIAFALIGGGGKSGDRPIKVKPERIVSAERKTPDSSQARPHRPVRRRGGSLAIGLARRAPEPAKSNPQPLPAPPAAAPEAVPVYEAAPEPVAEPTSTPEASPAPAPETPAAVEFGM